MATDIEKAPEALQELVAKADTGARKPKGLIGKVIFGVALSWAVFQVCVLLVNEGNSWSRLQIATSCRPLLAPVS